MKANSLKLNEKGCAEKSVKLKTTTESEAVYPAKY